MNRLLDLYIDTDTWRLVNNPIDSSLAELRFVKGDTYQIVLHALKRTLDDSLNIYEEIPWPLGTAIRASLLLIDAAPESGVFKLTVVDPVNGNQTTPFIDWPAQTTEGDIAAFKAKIIATLCNLAAVGVGGVKLSDPVGTPINFLYLTWTDPAKDLLIEASSLGLAPECTGKTKVQRNAPGFQQLLKLIRTPFVTTVDFDYADPPEPLVFESQVGAPGQNEIQILTIPKGVTGALQVTHSGVGTELMKLPVTAAQIQGALNAIVASGDTNPSFRVSPIDVDNFAIEFIGPLANAPQPALDASIIVTSLSSEIVGTLPIISPRFERHLNGARSAALQFELVIVSPLGEGTLVEEALLVNEGTESTIIQDLEEIGAVVTKTETVFIHGGGTPYVEASPGFQYLPPAAGGALAITHNLNTRQPFVRVAYQYTTAPERWRDLAEHGEFWSESTSLNAVLITFATALSVNPLDPHYFGRYRIYIASPDGRIVAFTHQHLWTECRLYLPDGPTVADKFAQIDAALGIVGGLLKIASSNITGQITASQIDLTSLIQTLSQQTAFSTLLTETLKTSITNSEVLTSMLESLKELETWKEFLRTELLEIFSSDPTGIATFFRKIPDVTYIVPNPTTIPGPTVKRLVPISEETTTVDGGTTTKLVTTRQVEEAIVTQVTIFGPLSAALTAPAAGGTVGGVLTPEHPEALIPGRKCTVVVGGAEATAVEGRERVKFAQGDVVTFKNGHWYKIVEIPAASNQWWPAEWELEVLRPTAIRGNQLAQGNRWSIQFSPSFLLEGNCLGESACVIEQAAIPAGAPFGNAVWTPIIEVPIQLTPAPTTHGFGVIVDRTGPAAFSGKVFTYGVETAFVPAGGDLMIRARQTKGDIDPSVADPRGALSVSLRGATDSVTEIPD